MEKPAILQIGPYPEWDQEPLSKAFEIHKLFEATDKSALLQSVGPSIRGIATRGDLTVDRALIEACVNLEIIAVYGVGYDGVDMQTCVEQNIRVTNTPDVLTGDVADLAVAMMLCQAREVIGADRWARDGSWRTDGMYKLTRRVQKGRAGILGLGRIGQAIAQRLVGFDMKIGYSALSAKEVAKGWDYYADPVELARNSDFLFVTLTATEATHNIVDKNVLNALGPEGMLINVSRAANVDENALLEALENGSLGAAALDVFESEPNIDPRFLELGNVLLQPHAGSGTVDTRKDMGQLMRDNLTAHFAGRTPITPVT